jgi:hypothetical protein
MEKNPLPLKNPIQQDEERWLIWTLLLALLLLTLFAYPLGVRRAHLLSSLSSSEGDARFLIEQIYKEKSDIDVAIIGNCTLWWQLYTPDLKAQLEKKHQRPMNVLTFGYNHFGSDLPYLILKDLVQNRKVKNLILATPKIEDYNEFPHRNAISWWLYPSDLPVSGELSVLGHVKLLGLSFFTSLRRIVLASSAKNLDIPSHSAKVFGFNTERIEKSIAGEFREPQVPALSSVPLSVHSKREPLAAQMRIGSPLLQGDWNLFYKKIADIAREQNIHVTFVDSPHAAEFESDSETITWGFENFFREETDLITLPFKQWKEALPPDVSNQVAAGHNLTFLGARLFTAAIGPSLVETIKP